MELLMEEVLEVTKTSISIRGTWGRQKLGKEPDLSNLKFSVKCSDGSTLKYSNWEKFQEAGGDYFTRFGKVWPTNEGTHTITFYLTDAPSVKLEKSIKVERIPLSIETIFPKKVFHSGDSIAPVNFNFKVRYDDNSVKVPEESELTVEPQSISKTFIGELSCIFTYSEKDLSISKEYKINVEKKLYSIENKPSDFGNTRFILGGKEMKNLQYSISVDGPILIKIRAVSNDMNYKFMRWELSSDLLQVESDSQETLLTIPENFGEDIWVKSIWDEKVLDSFGNIYTIEDGILESVELHSDEVVVPESVRSIAAKVFNDAEIKEISLPKTLQTIGVGAFSDCVNLTHIDIPSSVTLIDNSAFTGCFALESVKFNQTKPFTLGSRCFKDCTSLKELDFFALKDNFKNCVFGDGTYKDVWAGCKLRTIKLTKGNFMTDSVNVSADSSITIRTPGFFKVHVTSKTDTVRARVIGTTEDGSASGISQDLTKRNAYCRTFDKKNNEGEFLLNSYDYNQDYDLRESCGCYVVGEGNTHFDVEIYGMGSSQFRYDLYVNAYSNNRFTSNGSSHNFYNIGSIGKGFNNWNMMDYVNDLLYPNITTEDGIRLIDLMLPIYNRRQF